MVMVPVPLHIVPQVHQMLASYGVMRPTPSHYTGHFHPVCNAQDCTWHPMPRSEHHRIPSAHATMTGEVVRKVSVIMKPTASSSQESPGAAPIYEHHIDANVVKLVQYKAPMASAMKDYCMNTKRKPSNDAATSRTVIEDNSIPGAGAIDAADGITPADGVAVADNSATHKCKERKSAIESRSSNDLRARAKRPRSESLVHDFVAMKSDNATILTQDNPGIWDKGVHRFHARAESAAKVLSWVVDNTSRKLSVIATDVLLLNGFHEWDAVHASTPNDARQLQHTFVIARAQRRAALRSIPGFADLVADAQHAIESMRLADAPEKLEWLTAHILNQGDVNARFEYHQDTNEERNKETGRRDRRVMYTAIIKLNRGGCTSMEVCGEPEVFYHSPCGSGLIFRSNLHHRTEKAEQGIWKLTLFFGVFV